MSGLIPQSFINEIIHRIDIVELIQARLTLKKAGRNYQACCPFHTENSPSFTVSPVKQFYHCFGCGASGNVIGFLMAYDRLGFVEAVETFARQLGMEIPHTEKAKNKIPQPDLYLPLQKKSDYYQQQLRHSPQAIQYFKERGISGSIAKTYALGYAPDVPNDAFRDRVIFPIRDLRGRVIGFGGRVRDKRLPKYLNSSDSPIFHKSTVLYGLYEARQANRDLKQLLVVEGYMDVISLATAGITYTVATLGTATTSLHIQRLFQQTRCVIFCFDGDKAGRTAAWRALVAALPALQDDSEIKFLFLPEGEDPDSLIRQQGKEVFLRHLAQTQSLADFFFTHLKAQVNLHTVEGRAKLAKLALSHIESIAAPIFKEMMLNHLSEIVRLEKHQLYQFVRQEPSSYISAQKIRRTPMRQAIALLLQNTYLINKVVIDIDLLTLPGSELLKEIIALLKQNPGLSTGNLLEYFQDKNSTLVHTLSAWDLSILQNVDKEFEDTLYSLQRLQREKDIQLLIQKAHQQILSKEEEKQLQALLFEEK